MKNYKNIMALLILITEIALAGCSSELTNVQTQCEANTCGAENISQANAEVQKVEVYHFHGTAQCYSCKTVGAYAEETVNLFYQDEIRSGKVVFQSINYDLPENKELATKYGVGGSSLWIGVYDSQGFHPEQNTDVWLKINNKDDYLLYLKSVIDKRLAGDFS